MANLTIMDHPLIQHKISILRDKRTGNMQFRKLAEEISTLIAYGYQADVSMKYLFGKQQWSTYVGRILLIAGILLGGIVDNSVVWAMGDTGAGMMAWTNLLAIVLLAPKAWAIMKDYENQFKAARDPIFDPAIVGIEDKNGVWTEWVEKKKARGDYENEALGYKK